MRYKTLETRFLGTNIKIRILHENPESILNNCEMLLTSYHNRFSFYNPDSELSKINQNAGIEQVEVKKDLFHLIELGKKHSTEDSNLNICIGPVVKLWDIGFDTAKVPNYDKIFATLKYSNPDNLMLYESSIYLSKKEMKIDLGAISKGFIADKILEYLKSENIISAIVNLGGNILTHGFNLESPNLNWRIGIQDPGKPRGNHLLNLEINDMSIVTSGVYERYFSEDNKIFHHIIDPRTGYPVDTDMLSLTIITEKSIDGDIWSSKLFGKSFEEIDEKSSVHGFEAILIFKGNIVKQTKGCKKYMVVK